MKIEKLSRDEFAHAIKLGLGRAVLHVREYGDVGVEDLIEESLIQNQVFDMQLEGSRTSWLLDILMNTGHMKRYAESLLTAFAKEEQNDYNLVQQIELCSALFDLGYEDFRKIGIAKVVALKKVQSYRLNTAGVILDFCGMPGFIFAAHLVGSDQYGSYQRDGIEKERDIDGYDYNAIFERAKNYFDDTCCERVLCEISTSDDSVQKFKSALEEFNASEDGLNSKQNSPQKKALSLEDVVQAILRKEKVPNLSLSRLGKRASQEELERAFKLLLTVETDEEKMTYANIFQEVSIPHFDVRLFALLDTENLKLKLSIAEAISGNSDKHIRPLAIEFLSTRPESCADSSILENKVRCGILLLRGVFQPTDMPLLLEAFATIRDPQNLHWAGSDIIDWGKQSNNPVLSEVFIWLLANDPDSFCRERVLEQLIKWNACPDELLYESQFDFFYSTQLLARGERTRRLKDLELADEPTSPVVKEAIENFLRFST